MQEFERLVDFFAAQRFEDYPQEVRDAALRVVLDDGAAILAGSVLEEVRSLRGFAETHFGQGKAFLAPDAHATPAGAALVNGTAGVALEVDEGNRFTLGHPGAHVLPALWAALGAEDTDGGTFLACLIAGYEIASRMARSVSLWPDAHPHGTWGSMGGAAAVGLLRGRPRDRLLGAIAVAGHLPLHTTYAAPFAGSSVRNLYSGYAALSALIADEAPGITASPDGIRDVYPPFRPEPLVEELGQRYFITENYFKPFAACRYTHGTIEALQQLRPAVGRPEDVRAITVETYAIAARLTAWPHNTLSAKFSIPWAAAAALEGLADDPATFVWSERLAQRFAPWRDKVQVRENPEFTRLVPDLRPTGVTLELADGRSLEARVDLPVGEGARPLGLSDLMAKARRLLASAGIAQDAAETWLGAILELPRAGSARETLERGLGSEPPA